MARVKICGITGLGAARFCAEAGAAYLGFVQDPASPRYVRPEEARRITAEVPGAAPVGIFVDEDAEAVNRACARAGFALAQLDGHEPPEVAAAVEVPVIKTFRVQHDAAAEQLRALMLDYAGAAAFVRLETRRTSLWGGEGESLNWRLVRELAAEFDLFLAGDFRAGNAREAAERMRPFALDLEAPAGRTPREADLNALAAFLDACRQDA